MVPTKALILLHYINKLVRQIILAIHGGPFHKDRRPDRRWRDGEVTQDHPIGTTKLWVEACPTDEAEAEVRTVAGCKLIVPHTTSCLTGLTENLALLVSQPLANFVDF